MARPNPFDQFDDPDETRPSKEANPFDKFDTPAETNPFDQFDEQPQLDRFGQPIGQELDTSVPPPSYQSDQGRLSSAGGAFMRGFGSIVASLPKAIGEGSVILANKFGDDPIWGNPDKLTPEDTTSYQIGESIEKWFNKFAVNPAYQDEFLASALPQGAGSMAGFLAGGFAARAAGLPAWLASGGLGATATGVEQVDDYLRELAEDETADPEMRENAFGLGAALGVSEAAPIQLMLNRLDVFTGGTVTQILKEGFKGGLEELTQEVLQSVGQNYIASDILEYDPDRGLFTGTQEAGEVGFTLGFLLNTLAATIGARRAGRIRDAGDETGDGKIHLDDIEAPQPMDMQDVLGDELPPLEDEIQTQRADDVPPPEALEDLDIQMDRPAELVGGQYVEGDAEIDPVTGDVVEKQPAVSYFDNRLKRNIYRDRLKHLVDEELVPGGGVSLVPDHNFVGGESDTRDDQGRPQAPLVRTPSMNPDWYQRLMEDSNYQMSVEKVRKAADKAIAGERLGVRQARVIGAILDQITAERLDSLEYARNQLQVARDARAAAGLQPADDWLFEEDEYPDDFDGLSRTFAELLDQAQTLDEQLGNQVEALMESQADDAQVLAAITKLIGEFNGRKSQENAAALAQTQGQAEIPGPGTQPIPGEPAVPAPGAEQPAAGRRPAESLPAEQEVAPAAPAKAMEQFQTGDRVRITAEGFNNIEGTLTEEALNGFMVQYTDPELGFTEEQFIELEDLEIVEKQLPQERLAAAEKAYKEQDRRKKKQPGRKQERRKPGSEERRAQWMHRKEIDEMSPEERKAAIEQLRGEAKKHPKTGIGSPMAWEQVEKKSYIAAIDADDLKYVNDALGESAGDQLLQKIADALKAEFGEDAFHTGGDEFKTHGDEYGPLASKLVNAQKALEDAKVEGPGGSMTGIGFSWGIGYDVDEADRKMKQDKKDRTEAGKRAKRGEAPEGVTLKEKPEEEAAPEHKGFDADKAWEEAMRDIDADLMVELSKLSSDELNKKYGTRNLELAAYVHTFNEFIESMQSGDHPVTNVFAAPDKSDVVRMSDKIRVYNKKYGWMTPEQAKAKIQEWEDNAVAQGKTQANANKVVLSLFDLSGTWSQPWEQAGYDVWRFDIQQDGEMGDVNNFNVEFFNDWFGSFEGKDIHAILAACPCTDFAVSGAKHFAAKDSKGVTISGIELVRQTLRTIEYFRPAVWAIENPVGRINKLGGLPPWRLSFDPNAFGEDYTKKTLIWGRFNADLPIAPTEATEGSKMWAKYGGKSVATKNARSVTPEGFAYAFFDANNAVDHPAMTIANKYDRLDRKLIEQAVAAGITEEQIDRAVEDLYYQELDDQGANEAIADLIAGTGKTAKVKKKKHPGKKKAEPQPVEVTPAVEGEAAEFKITIEGMEGKVTDDGFVSVEGKFASHTGYRSLGRYWLEDQPGPGTRAEKAQQVAQELYDEHKEYAFMVWQEHAKDGGWKDIHSFGGEHEIRLPDWHEGKVAAVLEEAGFTQDENAKANSRWAIPEDRIKAKDLRKAVAPIRKNGTRFADEQQLADELRDSLQNAGLMEGFELTAQTEEQLSEKEAKVRKAQEREAVPAPEAFELEGEVTPIEQSAAQPDMFSAIDEQAHEAAASPTNDKSPPSKKQIEANNYAKGHPDKAKTQGFEIVIENPEGTRRKPEWPPMAAHYGDLVGTVGADGDPIDVFLKPGLDEIPAGTPIFVIDQKVNGKFDEHKVFFGFDSKVQAKNAYTASYTKGFDGILENTQTTPEELQAWIDDLKANEGQRQLSFGDWTRSQPGYVLAVRPIHWLMQHAERVTTFEGNQQIDTWKFNGRLPKNMVNELKQIAKDVPGFRRSSGAKTEKYSFTLENTEQVSDSIVFGFGTTKSTANSINFQRMRYTEGAAETAEVQPTDYANFAGRVVTWEQQDESGVDIIIEVDADEIMRDYDQRIAALEQLVKDCG